MDLVCEKCPPVQDTKTLVYLNKALLQQAQLHIGLSVQAQRCRVEVDAAVVPLPGALAGRSSRAELFVSADEIAPPLRRLYPKCGPKVTDYKTIQVANHDEYLPYAPIRSLQSAAKAQMSSASRLCNASSVGCDILQDKVVKLTVKQSVVRIITW
jgi:hypothetical protein